MLACAHPTFDGPVILFQNIIEILYRSMLAILLQSRAATAMIIELGARLAARRWLGSAKRDSSPAYPLSCVDEVVSCEAPLRKRALPQTAFPRADIGDECRSI
jgi:hypothetical protein